MCGLWTGIKNFGSKVKSGIKQGAKWAWNHREGIGKAVGFGLNVASKMGVPWADTASQIVKGVANVGKALGEDKFSKGVESYGKKKQKVSDESSLSTSKVSNYSINPRANGATKEGQMFNAYRSHR